MSGEARLLRSAAQQGIRYDERSTLTYQRDLLREAAERLALSTLPRRPWRRNRNADLWRLDGPDRSCLLKVLVSKPAATIVCEYANLLRLDELSRAGGGFRVPRPVYDFTDRSAYVMEFVRTRPLNAALLQAPDVAAAAAPLAAAGRALGAIHAATFTDDRPLDVDAVADDLRFLPWRPADAERATLQAALALLRGCPLRQARLYLDFDPANMGWQAAGPLVLFDPAERDVSDAVQWDLGTFALGLRRVAWRRPGNHRRWMRWQPDLQRAFIDGYLGGAAALDRPQRVLLILAEIVRLAQLWRWWLEPWRFRHRVTGMARALYAWPWLQRERQRQFRRLRQETERS